MVIENFICLGMGGFMYTNENNNITLTDVHIKNNGYYPNLNTSESYIY